MKNQIVLIEYSKVIRDGQANKIDFALTKRHLIDVWHRPPPT
jgi:hypothetical protein